MFYAHFVLSKKGPLARIWLAAHWDKKLTRAHVFETNISSSVEAILEPKLKMALRTSGHLLLGVVRIYSRKTKYLLADCNEAFVKIKMAFRPGVINLDDDTNRENAINAITLPTENIQEFEATIADLDDLNMNTRAINQSRPEDITMREDFGEINIGRQDDDFGDSTFDESGSRELIREAGDSRASIYNRGDERVTIHGDDFGGDSTLIGDDFMEKSAHGDKQRAHPLGGAMDIDDDLDDNFGGGFLDNENDDDESFGGDMDQSFFAGDNLFEDPSARKQLENITSAIESHMDPSKFHPLVSETPIPNAMGQTASNIFNNTPMYTGNDTEMNDHHLMDTNLQQKEGTTIVAQTNLGNESSGIQLQPVDTTTMQSMETKRTKRKRRLVIDEQKAIPSEVMKLQMQDTSDITANLDLAPPTKKLMYWKENGSVDKLFQLPARALHCRVLQRIFIRNLRTMQVSGIYHQVFIAIENEDITCSL
ncbi:Double-strand-break repair protein rad21 [Cichlidogyrus casuarinus]|uniref:Double-strand-break repair protein rad21 n=1 Tax=Cichlidogyrus casuarinus TaxID=1844966 RepID=A0ABD2QEI7_9PLAT